MPLKKKHHQNTNQNKNQQEQKNPPWEYCNILFVSTEIFSVIAKHYEEGARTLKYTSNSVWIVYFWVSAQKLSVPLIDKQILTYMFGYCSSYTYNSVFSNSWINK